MVPPVSSRPHDDADIIARRPLPTPPLPQVAVSVVPPNSAQQHDAELIAQRSEQVKAYFLQHLGVAPDEEGRVYIGFLVPRAQEDRLMPFLKQLELDSVRLRQAAT